MVTERVGTVSFEQRCRKVLKHAVGLYEQQSDWLVFFREVLGVSGIMRRLLPSPEMQAEFERTEEFARIQEMLGRLRQQAKRKKEPLEPTRVVTVRLPKSVHEALLAEASIRGTSMNRLCISKLLQVMDQEFDHSQAMDPDAAADEG